MQGNDIFGNTVQFSETYLVCIEKKGNHSFELRTWIAADAANVGIAVNLLKIPLFTWQATVSLLQEQPHR